MSSTEHNLREEFLKNGYVVLKSVFNKNYISQLREKMISLSFKEIDTYEILLDKDVESILLNEKLIETIKKILATKSLLYFSESNIMHTNDLFTKKGRYHKDARGESKNISYEEEYPIIRFGVYFQNVKNFSGGLKIRKRSHKYFLFRYPIYDTLKLVKHLFFDKIYSLNSLRIGKGVNIEIEEGDIVIWNLRTHHSGMSRRLKLFPKLCLWPFFEQLLPNHFFLPHHKDRVAMFCAFAKNDLKNENIYNYVKIRSVPLRLSQIKSNPNLLSKLNSLECELPY